MKQSKKLLSIFLAMLMLLGTVSVVGNAALVKSEVAYDSIDNAKLTPEQVADIILDMLDNDVLAGMDTIDLSIIGKLRLNSVDHIFEDICSLRGGLVWAIGSWLLADVGGLKFEALAHEKDSWLGTSTDWDDPYQRSDGNLVLVYQLLQFIADNAETLSKAAYGIGTDGGISLGLVGSFLSLGEIEDILGDLPGFLTRMVYDMLIHGSYNKTYTAYDESYPSAEELNNTLPGEVDTLDKMVNVAIKNLLTKPQKCDWVPKTDNEGNIIYQKDESGEFILDDEKNKIPETKKVWDTDSYLLNETTLNAALTNGKTLDLSKNSFFTLLDIVLPVAYKTFGTVVLNHDVKKIFMEAMGVDFVRITDEAEIASIKTTSATNAINKYIDVETAEAEMEANNKTNIDTSSVKNYFCNAQMWKVGDTWYFRDYVTTEVGTDDEGNPITDKIHRFFKAQTYSKDALYEVFNWDYYLTDDSLNFEEMLKAADGVDSYGSLAGSLNHIIHVIFENAINADFLASKGTSVDKLWADGGNDNFNKNLMNTAKFLLTNYTFMFFGRNEAYVDLDTLEPKKEFVDKINSFDSTKASDREGLIAYMLLPLLGDVLPQLVYTTDMFEPGLQIEQVAALLVREFLTDLTPQINDKVCNYDALIFVDPTLNNGRSLIKGQSSDYWMNIVLNMGLDLAAVYLDNITNFGVDLDALKTLHSYASGSTQPWQIVLEEIVDWAVLYIGSGSNSVIKGLDPDKLLVNRSVTYNYTKEGKQTKDKYTVANNYDGLAFERLSTALNTLLPLGIVNGCSRVKTDGENAFGFANKNIGLDVEVVFNKLKKDIIPTLNIEDIIGLFGRNNHETNFLGQTNLYKEILDLVNQLLSSILGNNILVVGNDASTILANAISKASLKTTINNLLTGLNSRKYGLLEGALPVLAAFIADWGGEQELASPDFAISETTKANEGSLNLTISLRNGSKGVWRSYMEGIERRTDNQYNYVVKGIKSLKGISYSGADGVTLAYGSNTPVTVSKSNITETGIADRIDITYQVTDEDGNLMADKNVFTKSYFTYVSFDDDKKLSRVESSKQDISMPAYLYYAEEDLESLEKNSVLSFSNEASGTKTGKLTVKGQATHNGITIESYSEGAGKNKGFNKAVFKFDRKIYEPVGKAGAYYDFTYNLNNSSDNGDRTTRIFVYSGADYALLEDLVNDEVAKARVAEDYNIKNNEFNTYIDALANGMAIIYNPRVDGNFWTNCYARYDALQKAVEALEAVEKTDAEKATTGGSIDGAVDNLKAQLDGIQNTKLDGKDYRTYMLYRWERYKDARSDANWIIDLKEEVKFGAPTKHFPYGSYSQAKYTNLVSGDKYADFLLGLLVDMTEEEAANAQENYKNRSNEYYGQTTLDVAQYSNLLTRTSQRLILRTTTPVKSYLQKEINSAMNDIGDQNNNGYSAKSWAPYAKALADAKAALNSDSQDVIFAAKYQLQVTRNNLRTAAKEADYDELATLIAQAENALATQAANKATYVNADEDFGKLLVALGYSVGETKLFGGAKDVFNTSYDKHDQDEVDDAADELKAALAKLEFKNFSTTKPDTVGTTAVETGETDENGEPVKENIYTAKVNAKQYKAAVESAIKGGNTEWDVQISFDENYTAEDAGLTLPVGTGATVTIIKTEGGVKVPVATIKVIVEGDVTGDGVIDGIDCMVIDLVANGNTSLGGVYLEAGDLASNAAADQRITLEDLNAVANKAVS